MDIDFLRTICLAFPAVTEEVKWDNDLCFCVGGRMFTVAALEGPFKCSFKVKDEEFEELSVSEGMIPAPYMARAKWVQVVNPGRLNKKEWEHYLRQSYDLVKARLTKKERTALGLG